MAGATRNGTAPAENAEPVSSAMREADFKAPERACKSQDGAIFGTMVPQRHVFISIGAYIIISLCILA